MNFTKFKAFWNGERIAALAVITVLSLFVVVGCALEQAANARDLATDKLIHSLQQDPLGTTGHDLKERIVREDFTPECACKVVDAWVHARFLALQAKGPVEAIMMDTPEVMKDIDLTNPEDFQARTDAAMYRAQVWHEFISDPTNSTRFSISTGHGTNYNPAPDVVITEQVSHNILGRTVLEPKGDTHITFDQVAQLTALNTAEETRDINSRFARANVAASK
jgi:hypothetical protein